MISLNSIWGEQSVSGEALPPNKTIRLTRQVPAVEIRKSSCAGREYFTSMRTV